MPRRPATTPRKKPRQQRAQTTVEALLDATARVLVTTGYDRASTNRVALAAGVSVGSLYQYFPSKEALVTAVAERHARQVREVIDRKLVEVATRPLGEAVREMVQAVFAAHQVDPALHRVLHEQVPRIGRLDRILDDMVDLQRLLVGYLGARAGELRLPAARLETAATLIVTTVEAVAHTSMLAGRMPGTPEALCDELVVMLVRYLEE